MDPNFGNLTHFNLQSENKTEKKTNGTNVMGQRMMNKKNNATHTISHCQN